MLDFLCTPLAHSKADITRIPLAVQLSLAHVKGAKSETHRLAPIVATIHKAKLGLDLQQDKFSNHTYPTLQLFGTPIFILCMANPTTVNLSANL